MLLECLHVIKCNYLPGEYTSHDYVSAMWSYKENDVHVKIEGGFTFHTTFPFQASYMASLRKPVSCLRH